MNVPRTRAHTSLPYFSTLLFFFPRSSLSRNLLPANVKSTKRKTPVVKKSLNPHFDHTFVYKELSLGHLRDMCLELTVWDRESLTSNEFMGGVRLSAGIGTLAPGNSSTARSSTACSPFALVYGPCLFGETPSANTHTQG